MIFFDLDDTLLDHRRAQRLASLEWYREMGSSRVPHSEESFPTVWHAAAVRSWAAFERGEISFLEQRCRRIRDVLREPHLLDEDADLYFERYLPLYEANWQLFPDVLPTLELLSEHRLGLLTHGDPVQQRLKIERLGLTSMFETITVLAPSPRSQKSLDTFKSVAQAANSKCADCFYIGNELQNSVMGACLAGWNGVWLERSMTLLAPAGVESISSLHALPVLVKNLMV